MGKKGQKSLKTKEEITKMRDAMKEMEETVLVNILEDI